MGAMRMAPWYSLGCTARARGFRRPLRLPVAQQNCSAAAGTVPKVSSLGAIRARLEGTAQSSQHPSRQDSHGGGWLTLQCSLPRSSPPQNRAAQPQSLAHCWSAGACSAVQDHALNVGVLQNSAAVPRCSSLAAEGLQTGPIHTWTFAMKPSDSKERDSERKGETQASPSELHSIVYVVIKVKDKTPEPPHSF